MSLNNFERPLLVDDQWRRQPDNVIEQLAEKLETIADQMRDELIMRDQLRKDPRAAEAAGAPWLQPSGAPDEHLESHYEDRYGDG